MKKKRVLIFGAGQNFIHGKEVISELYEIAGVVDNAIEKQGKIVFDNLVLSPDIIKKIPYDAILVTPSNDKNILEQLLELGIDPKVIIRHDEIFEKVYEGLKIESAFLIYGGIGDFLISKNYLYALNDKYDLSNSNITVCVNEESYENAKVVFDDSEIICHIKKINMGYLSLQDSKDYDLILRFCIVPYVQYFNGKKIMSLNPNLGEYILRLNEYGVKNYNIGFSDSALYYQTLHHIFEEFPNKNYYSFCDLFDDLGITEDFMIPFEIKLNETEYLQEINLMNKCYITVDTGLNHNYLGKKNTRAWPHEKWQQLAELLKRKYPNITLVQIGNKMSDNDNINADLNLNGKTNIEQVKVLLKHAFLHIDYEGGLVHIRHILKGGTSVVLYGSTSVEHHAYSENINIRTQACKEACEWKSNDWLFDCPREFERPICMETITPEMVLERVEEFIACCRK